MTVIIFDLEATCWDPRNSNQNETIEIGAVALDGVQTIDTFSRFIRPKTQPILSDFCKKLTTITQEQVDSAQMFPEVYRQFIFWATKFKTDPIFVAWGGYDRNQLLSDCRLHNIPDFCFSYTNLKEKYGKMKGIKPCGMSKALAIEGIKLVGTHHRGIDDAKNIAEIYIRHVDKWKLV